MNGFGAFDSALANREARKQKEMIRDEGVAAKVEAANVECERMFSDRVLPAIEELCAALEERSFPATLEILETEQGSRIVTICVTRLNRTINVVSEGSRRTTSIVWAEGSADRRTIQWDGSLQRNVLEALVPRLAKAMEEME